MFSIYRKFSNVFKFSLFHFVLLLFATQTVHAASIYLIWDENEETDLWGYRIYYRTSSGNYGSPVDAGKVTSFELSGLTEGTTYYIALTAYDTSNNESEKTDEKSGIAHSPSVTSTTSTTLIPNTSSITPTNTSTTAPVTTSTPENNTTTIPVTTTVQGDITFPTGTIIINNGDKITHSPNVTLNLFATFAGMELGENALMTLSNDNKEWSDPEPYVNTKTWTLNPAEGNKTVYVKFRDVSGNWMIEPAKDQIILEGSTPQKLQPVSIEASSESPPLRRKEKVADGNQRSLWSTARTRHWQNEFITLDLGEVKSISKIDIYASKILGIDYFPVDFQIQISSDNLNWEEMHAENNYKLQSARSDSWNTYSCKARYIRIYITKAKTFLFFFYLAQIAEIEVYGCNIPEQNLASGDKDEKSEDNRTDETGDVRESNQGLPTVPGKPVITFY